MWFKEKWRGVRLENGLWDLGVLEFQKFFIALLSVEGKYSVKLPITNLIKFSRK